MSTTTTPDDVVLFHDGMHHCADCRQTALMPGSIRRRELLECDDAVYCPRCAREQMAADDWELRWGRELGLLDTIREDRSLALTYALPGCPSHYIVHREDHVYEAWQRCEDDDHRNVTTIGEASVVSAMKRAVFSNYVDDPPHTVAIVNAPINADTPETDRVPMTYERA